MNLLELQRRMAEDVRRPLTSDFGMQQETEDGCSISQLAEGYVKPNDRLTSFERLEIYNRQYWFRLIAAVSEDFPALAAVLGAKRFNNLVLAYLKENPSTSFTLRNLGRNLPMWLVGHPESAPARHLLLLDVARLEWAYIEAFDGGIVPPITQEDLGDLGADSTLSLQPHLQLLDLRYPVDELVLAVHKETPASDIVSNAVLEREQKQMSPRRLPTMRRAAIYLAVHRFDNSVYYRRIDREAFLLLSALQRRIGVDEAIEAAFADSKIAAEEQGQKIQQYFAHAAELGWFCRPHIDFHLPASVP
jgi:putative DNA-binding protein